MIRQSIDRPPRLSRAAFLKLASAAVLAPAMRANAAEMPLISRKIAKSRTGEELPVIGLGTSRVFNARGDARAMSDKTEIVNALLQGGGKVLDTAAAYGEAEEVCGEILQQQNIRSQAFVASKFGADGTMAGIASIEASFKRLRTDVIDLMYIHNMVDVETHLLTLQRYQAQGRFRFIGISDTSPDQNRLASWMNKIDFVEFAYSAGDREAEKRLLPMARDKGVGVFAAMPLGRGRLLNAMQGKDVPLWAKEELQCESFAQLLLKFAVSHPAVTAAIPATSKAAHMLENLAAGRGPMPDTRQRERIAALWTS